MNTILSFIIILERGKKSSFQNQYNVIILALLYALYFFRYFSQNYYWKHVIIIILYTFDYSGILV